MTAWMNLDNIILSERSQSQKTIYYIIPFILSARTENSAEIESRGVAAYG